MKPFILYHWAPLSRRKQIQKLGLCPGKPSRDKEWKPPYVCFSDSPSLAWALSAAFSDEPELWDLWMVWNNVPAGYERLPTLSDDKRGPTEFRVYERIFKKDIWHVGSRQFSPSEHNPKWDIA